MFTIYMHIFPNGKRYIGITSQKPQKRWKNGKGYANQLLMGRAIEKYGWDNIQHIILADGLTRAEASEMESFYIAKYKTNYVEFGYNADSGGLKGYQHSELSRKRVSETKKKNGDSKGSKNPMYDIHRYGEQNPFYGCKHSEETRKRMSQNHADVSGGNNPFSIKVYCDGIWYGSLREFADAEGYNKETISRWVRYDKVPQKYKDKGFMTIRRAKNAS